MDIAPLSGRIVVVGVCMHPDTTLPTKAVTKELTVIYTHGLHAEDFRFAIDMLAQGRIVAEPMVTAEVGMDEFPATFARLLKPSEHCKVMLDPAR
jgi:threonine dehydrogenase-like Zn-dependent dehydrogenase